jgi:hypothetical protein
MSSSNLNLHNGQLYLSDIAAGMGGVKISAYKYFDYVGYITYTWRYTDAEDVEIGRSVSYAGDMNGDGYGDLLIGAYDYKGTEFSLFGTENNVAYVVFGTANRPDKVELADIAAGNGGFQIVGIRAEGGTLHTSSAGDVNGDGYSDIIIGREYDETGGDYAGAAYIVYGGSHLSSTASVNLLDVAQGVGGFVIVGDAFDRTGRSISSAGDLNNDGYDDMLIGAPRFNTVGDGVTYVVFGSANLSANGGHINLADVGSGVGGFKIVSEETRFAYAGFSVSEAGDVNNDGYADILVSAYGDDGYSGAAYVIFGHDGLAPAGGVVELGDIAAGLGGFKIAGQHLDKAGTSVSSAGDVNGDGVDDILVGARSAQDGNGAIYVVYGNSEFTYLATTIELSRVADGEGGFKILSESEDGFGDVIGDVISSAGDVNGDGYDDIIIGSQYYDGTAYVVFGGSDPSSSTGVVDLVNVAQGIGGFKIIGEGEYHDLGVSVSAIGDINRDGYDDLLVGDPSYGAGVTLSAGSAAYVIYGGTAPSPSTSVTGTASNETFVITPVTTIVDGGAGFDIATVSGNRSGVVVSSDGDGTFTLTLNSRTVSLEGLERVQLTDGTIALDLTGAAGQTYRLYQAAFDRTPDDAGLSHNVHLMDGGLSIFDMANAFIQSAEFQQTYGASVDDTTFITLLYNNVLNRAPDDAGLAGWQDSLNGGSSRAQVLFGFSESTENKANVAAAIDDGIWLV